MSRPPASEPSEQSTGRERKKKKKKVGHTIRPASCSAGAGRAIAARALRRAARRSVAGGLSGGRVSERITTKAMGGRASHRQRPRQACTDRQTHSVSRFNGVLATKEAEHQTSQRRAMARSQRAVAEQEGARSHVAERRIQTQCGGNAIPAHAQPCKWHIDRVAASNWPVLARCALAVRLPSCTLNLLTAFMRARFQAAAAA